MAAQRAVSLEEEQMRERIDRRRFTLLVAGAIAVPAAGFAPGRAFAQDATPAATTGAAALAQMAGKVFSTGPNGEKPAPASDVTLTDDELQKIKDMKATAAIVMHYGGNDWSVAQTAGLKDQFGKMGIEVIAETDAGFKPEKQV